MRRKHCHVCVYIDTYPVISMALLDECDGCSSRASVSIFDNEEDDDESPGHMLFEEEDEVHILRNRICELEAQLALERQRSLLLEARLAEHVPEEGVRLARRRVVDRSDPSSEASFLCEPVSAARRRPRRVAEPHRGRPRSFARQRLQARSKKSGLNAQSIDTPVRPIGPTTASSCDNEALPPVEENHNFDSAICGTCDPKAEAGTEDDEDELVARATGVVRAWAERKMHVVDMLSSVSEILPTELIAGIDNSCLQENSDTRTVRRAYFQIARRCHPDKLATSSVALPREARLRAQFVFAALTDALKHYLEHV